MTRPIIVYCAAALFSGRETYFNLGLTSHLEALNYRVILPQRNGFEFGNLRKALADKLPAETVEQAVQDIVYFLDMGFFLPQADVIVANLDEPLDEGVIVEISYARLMRKRVVGFRTDVRSPYGRIEDPLGGLHFFPAYQCDAFVRHPMHCRSPEEAASGLEQLAAKLHSAVTRLLAPRSEKVPDIPVISRTVGAAEILFDGISNFQAERGLRAIAERYMANLTTLRQLAPHMGDVNQGAIGCHPVVILEEETRG